MSTVKESGKMGINYNGDPTVVKKDIQVMVNSYIEMYENMKSLEKDLKGLRAEIEPYMQKKGLVKINGTERGHIELGSSERPIINSRYTSYDVRDISAVISSEPKEIKSKVIVKAVDNDMLEFFIKTGQLSDTIRDLKITKTTPMFKVNPKG